MKLDGKLDVITDKHHRQYFDQWHAQWLGLNEGYKGMIEEKDRDWGHWETWCKFEGYKVKRLIINKGESISRQFHNHRDEIWVVVEGSGRLELGYPDLLNIIPLKIGDAVTIRKREVHKVYASENERLVAIEVQLGEITEETDILRVV